MSRKEDECVVNVVTEAVALTKPTFLIKVGEKFYATLALWEYDPHTPNLNEEQRKGIAEVEHVFRAAKERRETVHEAFEVDTCKVSCSVASSPGRRN